MTKSDRATVSFSPGQGWDYGFIEHPFVEEEKKKEQDAQERRERSQSRSRSCTDLARVPE